ncbi:hypothetical protein [Lactobacillus crispatus]|uniref:hypothetical protein n=1 Tax=Lactobacillus crispatus TaxID=47770 RepID=UPI00054EAE6C|nr:hypothetical protein [Lactobacillus crispatus]TDN09401.1 hypothetical protein CEE83_11750 [Lactobacillus crispatus]
MQVKIDFKNGNKTVFNADCYDADDLRRDLVQQNANGNHFFYINGYKEDQLIVDIQSIQSLIISR